MIDIILFKIMQREKFEALVEKAISSLPAEFQDRLENVDVVVEDWPASRQRSRAKLGHRVNLLGLYEGVPLTKRGRGYSLVLPDKITIFQKPIEAMCRGDEEIEREIQKVVRHEIAHHFGTGEERLREIESSNAFRKHREH
jgi:predicted Zn-dependent protease with MMP-like domain